MPQSAQDQPLPAAPAGGGRVSARRRRTSRRASQHAVAVRTASACSARSSGRSLRSSRSSIT